MNSNSSHNLYKDIQSYPPSHSMSIKILYSYSSLDLSSHSPMSKTVLSTLLFIWTVSYHFNKKVPLFKKQHDLFPLNYHKVDQFSMLCFHSLKKVSKTYRNNLSTGHILTHLLVVKESNIKKSHYYDFFMCISFILLSLFISYLYAHKDNLSCEVSLFIKVSNGLSPIFLLLYRKVMSLISSA